MTGKWGGLGATRYVWTPPVRRVVQRTLKNFDAVSANTYKDHPWPGWDRFSVDFWGPGGRGDPISKVVGTRLLAFLFNLDGEPLIRHTIFERDLWTSFGGYSRWNSYDHSGKLRHVHVTYWK